MTHSRQWDVSRSDVFHLRGEVVNLVYLSVRSSRLKWHWRLHVEDGGITRWKEFIPESHEGELAKRTAQPGITDLDFAWARNKLLLDRATDIWRWLLEHLAYFIFESDKKVNKYDSLKGFWDKFKYWGVVCIRKTCKLQSLPFMQSIHRSYKPVWINSNIQHLL